MRELGALVVEEAGRGVAQRGGLLLDGLHDLRVAVPEVHGDEPAAEIEELVAVDVVQVAALAADDDGGHEPSLRYPRGEDVLRVLLLDLGGLAHGP